jgi:hypothetical protein
MRKFCPLLTGRSFLSEDAASKCEPVHALSDFDYLRAKPLSAFGQKQT